MGRLAAPLAEDADIGVRLSCLGEPIRVVYDPRHVTREESPSSLRSFIRQRTRWQQGFLQVLRKGDWRRLPRLSQRALAAYTLAQPLLDAAIGLTVPLALLEALFFKLPLVIALLTFLPIYALVLQLCASLVGVFIFAAEFHLRIPLLLPLRMLLTFMPFLWCLAATAARATYREARSINEWEKTQHTGAHRTHRPLPAAREARVASMEPK